MSSSFYELKFLFLLLLASACSLSSVVKLTKAPPASTPPYAPSERRFWTWKGSNVRYQQVKSTSPPIATLLCVHGFGGNCDHFRRNLQPLADAGYDVYAIDLIGFGYSSKKVPAALNGELTRDFEAIRRAYASPAVDRDFTELNHPLNSPFNFYTWSDQLNDFHLQVIQPEQPQSHSIPHFIAANSIGSSCALQAAIDDTNNTISGVMLINPSIRGLNFKKFPSIFKSPLTLLQSFFRLPPVGKLLFGQIATTKAVRQVLEQAYYDANQVSDELVDAILCPGMMDNARDVFLDFISYSGGPLVEEQLKIISSKRNDSIQVSIGWGKNDPWEPLAEGKRLFTNFSCVRGKKITEWDRAGHCPQDEVPDLVNKFLVESISAHYHQSEH